MAFVLMSFSPYCANIARYSGAVTHKLGSSNMSELSK